MTPAAKRPKTPAKPARPAKRPASKAPLAGYSGKPTIDKLGIRPEHAVAVFGLADQEDFLLDLGARVGAWSTDAVKKGTDVVLLRADSPRDLARLASLERTISRDGMIWVVWPKGRPELKEDHVRAAALRAGLVDVKVCAFSATLSGLKLVIPVARR